MGSAEAYSRIAELYVQRHGDYVNAKKFWEKAAELGHVAALKALAFEAENGYFDLGHGVDGQSVGPTDPEKAFRLMEMAARYKEPLACRCLAGYYARGFGCTESQSEFVKWIRRAAEKGDTDAMCILGRRYMRGDYVEQDMEQAEYWLRRASEGGDEDAATSLSELLG